MTTAVMDTRAPSLDFCQAMDATTTPQLVHAGAEIIFANAAMQRLLGHAYPKLLGMRFSAWAAPEYAQALEQYGLRCLNEEDAPPAIEIEALTVSGSHRLVELSARRVILAESTFVLFTCVDLSDIRHVQTSLLDVGRVLHQIIENNPVATFVIDVHHKVTHWNAACAQLTGIEAFDVLGTTNSWQAFYRERRPLLADLIVDGNIEQDSGRFYGDKCRASPIIENAFESEDLFPELGQGGRWLYFTAAPLMDAQGVVVGAIETLQDITQRKQADDQLRQHHSQLEAMVADRTAELLSTHHKLEAFLENAPVGIIETAQQKLQRANRKFVEMFELGDVTPYGIPTRRFFCSDEDFSALGEMAQPRLTRNESLLHEMEVQTFAGNRRWVQLIAYVANPNEPIAGTWWIIQDRTEVRRVEHELKVNYERIRQTNIRLEEAQNQLLQAEKMASIGQLAAGVAHEINNPIGFVSSNLGTLRRYVEPIFSLLDLLGRSEPSALPTEIREKLAEIGRAVDLEFVSEDLPLLLNESEDGLVRVKKIVQDLKDFSRVDHADWQDADLNAGLESTLNVVMNEVKYKAEVRKDYGVLPPVRCIAAQLNQVFMNLIVNAAHAIAERGVITLTTRADGDYVWVEVKDTGTGMPEEVKRRIFEPFFTTKPVGKGTGLGLSLSFSIVQKHHGRIEVDSQLGEGTAFRIWVPVDGGATHSADGMQQAAG